MATCSVIDRAFNSLWSKGVLVDKKTKITDPIRFDNINQIYSNLAKSKFGVTNPGLFFNKNTQSTSHTGALNMAVSQGADSFEYESAVVNREFTDEFQDRFEDYYNQLALEESRKNTTKGQLAIFIDAISKPFEMTDTEREDLRADIEYIFTGQDKENLLKELDAVNDYESYGELLIKMCK